MHCILYLRIMDNSEGVLQAEGGNTPHAGDMCDAETEERCPSINSDDLSSQDELIENKNDTVGVESDRVASLPLRGLEKPAVGSGSFELGQELAGISLLSSSPCASLGKEGELSGQEKVRSAETRAKPPPSYVCPIGMDLMIDPVILATGHTYDRSSIERWIHQGNKTCPVTGMKLRHTEMTPNFALRSAIREWAAENGVPLPTEEVKTKAQSSKVIVAHRDSEDEEEGTVMSGHDEIVWALEKKGNSLVTASADSTVRIWDIPSKRCIHVLEDHRRPVLSLASTDDYIFSGSYDYTVRVWDWATQRRVATLRGHTDAVRALVVVGSRSQYVCSGSYDGTLRLWAIGTWECVIVLKGHSGPVRVLATCGDKIFSGSYDGTVRVWDSRTLTCLAVLKGHKSAVRALTSVGSLVCSGSDDATVRVWDANALTCIGVLRGHEDNVRVLSATEDFICSGSWDKTVRVWSIPSLQCIAVLEGHTEAVLALTAEKDFVVSGSYDGTLKVWDSETWRCTRCFDKHEDAVRVLASAGTRIFSGSYDGGVGIL